jgi:hypothetical protein
MKTYATMEVKPADIISGVETLRDTVSIHRCLDLCSENTIPSKTYLEWAQRGYDEGSDYGLSSCISNSKLAVCSTLDNLLVANHLGNILKKNYPYKIDVLDEIGISIPSVVHDLIIEPRNGLEHKYMQPDKKLAKDALGVAKLALPGISDDFGSTIALNWTAIASFGPLAKEYNEFPGWSNSEISQSEVKTVLFVDVFDKTPKALLIDEDIQEIRFVNLHDFTIAEAITFAQVLRSAYQTENSKRSFRYINGSRAKVYESLKILGGF